VAQRVTVTKTTRSQAVSKVCISKPNIDQLVTIERVHVNHPHKYRATFCLLQLCVRRFPLCHQLAPIHSKMYSTRFRKPIYEIVILNTIAPGRPARQPEQF
jgi:hypothetical protein